MHSSTLSPPQVYFHPRAQEPPWFFPSVTSAVLLKLAMLYSYWSLGGEESGSWLCCTPPALTFQQWGSSRAPPGLSEVAAVPGRVGHV